jgi:hypothetical protein
VNEDGETFDGDLGTLNATDTYYFGARVSAVFDAEIRLWVDNETRILLDRGWEWCDMLIELSYNNSYDYHFCPSLLRGDVLLSRLLYFGFLNAVANSTHTVEMEFVKGTDGARAGWRYFYESSPDWETIDSLADPTPAVPGSIVGLVVGTVVGVIAAAAIIGVLVWFFLCRKTSVDDFAAQPVNSGPLLEPETVLEQEVEGRQIEPE